MSRSIRMELPSLAKEGWPRHQVNGPVPLKSAARSVSPIGRNIKNGVVRSTSDNRWLERTTPSAPAKEASRLFLNGRSHPSFAKLGKGGEFHSDAPRHLLKSRLILNSLRSGGLNLQVLFLKRGISPQETIANWTAASKN